MLCSLFQDYETDQAITFWSENSKWIQVCLLETLLLLIYVDIKGHGGICEMLPPVYLNSEKLSWLLLLSV